MEQVPTTISRRKLTLGGPAAVALAPLAPLAKFAPVAAVAALGATHNAATAAAVDNTVPGFVTYYKSWQKTILTFMQNALWDLIITSRPDLRVYNRDVLFADPDKVAGAYSALTQAQRDTVADSARYNYGGYLNIFNPAARPEYNGWVSYVQNLSLNQNSLIYVTQHNKYAWNLMLLFAKFAFSDQAYDDFLARAYEAEVADDVRNLRGITDDDLKETTVPSNSFFTPSYQRLDVVFGNKRQEIERADLIPARSWLVAVIFGATYTAVSTTQHGITLTAHEPTVGNRFSSTGQTVSDAVALNQTATDGIDYYVEADISQNGPFPNMTVDQSRRMLRGNATYAAHETGMVYESYLIAQLAIRAFAQILIAGTRQLINSKKIDLAAIQTYVKNEAGILPAVVALAESSRNKLLAATGLIFAAICSTAVVSAFVMAESKKVVNENRNRGTTAEADKLAVKNRVVGYLTGAQGVTQLAALGFLNFSAFAPGESADQRIKWIGIWFGLADLTGGISDYVNVFRAGTQGTAAGITQLLGGTARITGSFVGIMASLYKITNYKQIQFFFTLNPLKFNSATAAIAAFFYALSTALVAT